MKKLLIGVGILVGIGVVVGSIGGAATKQMIKDNRTEYEAIGNDTEIVDDNAELVDWWLANEDRWNEMGDHFAATDLEGAAEVMNSLDTIPDASLNGLFIKFKSKVNMALIRFNMGDLIGATDLIKDGTVIMQDITDEIVALNEG